MLHKASSLRARGFNPFCATDKEQGVLSIRIRRLQEKTQEHRRRTRPIGVFANRESVERIVFAVFHHLNVNWENNPLNEFTHKD